MTLIKDEATTRLDAVNRAGLEAIGLFDDLESRLGDEELRELVETHASAQRRLLERAANLRRGRGEMPQPGDPERSHLEAVGAFVRAAFSPDDGTQPYVDSLLEAVDHVEQTVDDALAVELPAEIRDLLVSFKQDSEQFRRELEARR